LEKKDDKGKYLEDSELTDKEIQDVLYELKEGKKTLATQRKADSEEDDTPNNDENKKQTTDKE
jgi:5-bromo-4-chloroindolyl phosphate hydrolysis protein